MTFSLARPTPLLALLAVLGACGNRQSTSASSSDAAPLPPLVTEAGFIDIPPQPTAARYAARIFYDFQPADTQPASRPLFVLFNGGPGDATSTLLLQRGTGRMTLDSDAAAGPSPVVNPASWTQFANLLYLDERLAGFSYGLLPAVGCVMSDVEDASDFVRALLTFLDGHVALRGNPVVLVGESYGGVRATWMLDLLLRYQTEAAKGGADLPALIQAHYDAVFPGDAGTPVDEATAARQFGWQVLIEPLVEGAAQFAKQAVLMPTDPYLGPIDLCNVDTYIATKPPMWTAGLWAQSFHAISDPTDARDLLGVDLRAISLLGPSSRVSAFTVPAPEPMPTLDAAPPVDGGPPPPDPTDGGPPPGTCFFEGGVAPFDPLPDALDAANAALTALLGPLGENDTYYRFPGEQCIWQPQQGFESGSQVRDEPAPGADIHHPRPVRSCDPHPGNPRRAGGAGARRHDRLDATGGRRAAWLVHRESPTEWR